MTSRELTARWSHEKVSDAERSFILNDAVFYEIIFALGVPPYDRSNLALWESVNFSRMGHARGLLDFFEYSRRQAKNGPKADDVLAEDFGFPAHAIPFPEEDRARFNKDLFHLTFSRCRFLEPATVKEWPPTILGPVHTRCVQFVAFVLSNLFPKQIPVRRAAWEMLAGVLGSRCEAVISFDRASIPPSWKMTTGRPLEDGLSRLTDWEQPQAAWPKLGYSDGANAVPITISSQ